MCGPAGDDGKNDGVTVTLPPCQRLKSPTSITIVVKLRVEISVFSKLTFILVCLVVSLLFPLPKLVMKGVGARSGGDDALALKVWAVRGEMVWFVFVAD